MALLKRKSWFEGMGSFMSKLPGFSRPDKHSLHFLNIAQFMGALNDNIFKLVIAYLIIDIKGAEHASIILAKIGAVYVIPFLLFSSTAGVLADRFSKQRLMMVLKGIEMGTMLLAMVAFANESVWGSYCLLFLLSTHSAMFGPPKYAIITELVPKDAVSKANGLITSFTYLAVIFGTFLASFLTDITGRDYVIVAGFCLLIAIIGFIATFGIRKTAAQGNDKKLNFLFVREIYSTLVFCYSRKHLLVAVCGSAYFLFIGAFVQLNIIPYAISSLKLTEVSGGYLFLSTAFGIALGAFIGGRVSKKRVELGLSCFAGFFIALCLFLLWVFSHHLAAAVVLLILLGIFGGLFIVPFDSFIQLFSPNEKRGQIIAANNFLSFCGVLFAAAALYFYSVVLGLSPSVGFVVTGCITLVLALLMLSRLSDLFLSFFSRCILHPLNHIQTLNQVALEKNPGAILILQNASWKKAMLLLSVAQNAHLLLRQDGEKKRFPWFNWVFFSVTLVKSDASLEPLLSRAKNTADETVNPCIMVESEKLPDALISAPSMFDLFKEKSRKLIYVNVDTSGPRVNILFKESPF
ncbi:MAG TPA: MFS transporter [Rhabdochlamydiaceae bacterium]|jgi:acyl-[acyl-carrier-protein]-phospholipid O-acyltransferase/long-chain-fatty-acid--[acyl-carrier-protein] ligase|nr:MFS transporter [Rhabdochlamydiaceae bacterium]